jgi:hypothetical protein
MIYKEGQFVAYFIGYIILFTMLVNVVLSKSQSPTAAIILFIVFLVGWFFVIGLATEHNKHKQAKQIISDGAKSGFVFLKHWIIYMACLTLVGGVFYLIS